MKKRAVKPLVLYVESLVVTDETIYDRFKTLLNSTDNNIIIENMKIYFAFFMYTVNLIYKNSLEYDPDLNIFIKLRNCIFLTVKFHILIFIN
jgi:hypothetical protein